MLFDLNISLIILLSLGFINGLLVSSVFGLGIELGKLMLLIIEFGSVKVIVWIDGCKYKVPVYCVLLPEKVIDVGTVLSSVQFCKDKLLIPDILANTTHPPPTNSVLVKSLCLYM